MKPTHIVVHISDSPFGDVEVVRDWHVNGNHWSDIGYHYVITNGYPKSVKNPFQPWENGSVHHGRQENMVGAHARGFNDKSIGICLIGKAGNFSTEQMAALYGLILGLLYRYSIPVKNVIGHYEADPKSGKTCPDINMSEVRSQLDRLYAIFAGEVTCSPTKRKT